MSPLDARKVQILQAIVNDYVLTTKPVGSERLIEVYNLRCKSATVRNEMAEMAEMGYLVQPHTSAGRIPTDRGYRYYVDELMNPPSALSAEEAEQACQPCQEPQSELAEIVLQTCRILSSLTSYPSLATDPAVETMTLRRLYLTEASPRHLLLVVLLSTGHVEHRLIEVEGVPGDTALVSLANYFNMLTAERELTEIAHALSGKETPPELTAHAAVLTKVRAALIQAMGTLSERRVFLEGATQFLRQPEFQDVVRLENLLTALEQRGALYLMLRNTLMDWNREISIVIGTENTFAPMQECSVITSSYHIGVRQAGYLGVVGPTRMNYDRAAAAVGMMARHLSWMLTNLSLA